MENVVLLPLKDEEAAPEAALESSHHLCFKSENKSALYYYGSHFRYF